MTRCPEDPPALYLRQVPLDALGDPGVWSTRLLPRHVTVERAYEVPTGGVLLRNSTET